MKEISRKRFNAYISFTRDPRIFMFAEEILWYENNIATLLGVILYDKIDNDFSVNILGRDENKQFRCIDTQIDFANIELAKEWLFEEVKEKENENKTVFPQGGGSRKGLDLFTPIVAEAKQHTYFRILANSPSHASAKKLLAEIAPHFYDIDGNFVEQFQTTGFDSRLWEIFLLCYFNEEFLKTDRTHNAPDFMISDGIINIGLEAVTVNRKSGIPTDPLEEISKLTDEYVKLETNDKMPLRFGSSLYSKLTHKTDGVNYWQLPHVKGKPFVLAIADFHEDFSMTWSTTPLINYLYGQKQYHYYKGEKLVVVSRKIDTHLKDSGQKIPSGFFYQPDTENISAILFASSGTLSKFNRIGKQCDFDEGNTIMQRYCAFHNHDPNASMPHFVSYNVSEKTNETWGEGVTIYHNPNAKHPLPLDFFHSAAQCFIEKGRFTAIMPPLHSYSSFTMLINAQKNKADT